MDHAAFARAYAPKPSAPLLEPAPKGTRGDPIWLVYLKGALIDRVTFYAPGMTADQVRRDLLHHGGYDAAIEVRAGGLA